MFGKPTNIVNRYYCLSKKNYDFFSKFCSVLKSNDFENEFAMFRIIMVYLMEKF